MGRRPAIRLEITCVNEYRDSHLGDSLQRMRPLLYHPLPFFSKAIPIDHTWLECDSLSVSSALPTQCAAVLRIASSSGSVRPQANREGWQEQDRVLMKNPRVAQTEKMQAGIPAQDLYSIRVVMLELEKLSGRETWRQICLDTKV